MKTNAVIFTSYNGITSILPTNLRSVPVFQIGLDRQSIPLTSEHLALYFKQYDHVILFKTNHTGDHLIQGTHSHVSGFLTLLFYTFARKFKKKLYYVNDRQQLVEITNGDGAPFRKLASLTDKKKMYTPHTHTVTSIQKIKVKNDLTAEQMSKQYFSWLELFTKLIYIDESNGEYSFKVRFAQTALLQLKENSAFRHDPLTAEFIINGEKWTILVSPFSGQKQPLYSISSFSPIPSLACLFTKSKSDSCVRYETICSIQQNHRVILFTYYLRQRHHRQKNSQPERSLFLLQLLPHLQL